MKTNTILFSALAMLALLPALAFGASKIVRPFEETFDLQGISKIVVYTQSGYIKVDGEHRSDAHVTVEQVFRNASESEADEREACIERTMETRGDVLYIEFRYDQSRSLWSFFGGKQSVNINVSIATAQEIDVELRTSGGSIEVASIDGFVQARTSGGGMKFHDINGNVDANTSGGGVEARRINGDADLSTSGGRITVASITGVSHLRTSGGSITAENMKGPLDAKTSGGGITASFPEGIDDDTRLKTSGGSITARLPEGDRFYSVRV